MLTLYDYFRSSACFRVRIALNLKKLDYETIPIHLVNQGGEQFSEHYSQINFQHLVPTFKDGNKVITQSLAIIEYLDELHPHPPLLPKDPFEKALIRSFAFIIAADTHPLNNLRVLKYLTGELQLTEEKKQQWYHHWMKEGLSSLEQTLNFHGKAKDFCFGNTPTIADICLVPQLYNAKRFNCDLSSYPTLLRIDENCQSHPAFIKAAPVEEKTTTKG